MPSEIPNRLLSDSPMAAYLNLMREAARARQPAFAPGLLASHTVHGVLYEALPQPPQQIQSGAEDCF